MFYRNLSTLISEQDHYELIDYNKANLFSRFVHYAKKVDNAVLKNIYTGPGRVA